MAKKPNHRFERRKREKARQERAAKRRARKQAKSSSPGSSPGSNGGGDPDLEGIVVGPQEKPKATEAEVERAIELAMNPGAVRQRKERRARPAGGKRLFVGNLDFGTDEAELRALFTDKGFTVTDASVVKDRETGRPRGFAFVELSEAEEAEKAIETFNGHEHAGRELRVNPADSH